MIRAGDLRVGSTEVTAMYLGGAQVWSREGPGLVFRGAHPMPQATPVTTHTFPVTNIGPAANGTHAVFVAASTHGALAPAGVTITLSTVDGDPVTPIGGVLRATGLGAIVAGVVDVSGRETVTMRITTSEPSINWTGALWTVAGTPELLGTSAGTSSASYATPPGTTLVAGIYLTEAAGLGTPSWIGMESRYQDSTTYPHYGFRGDYADGAAGTVGVTHNGSPARHAFYHLAV